MITVVAMEWASERTCFRNRLLRAGRSILNRGVAKGAWPTHAVSLIRSAARSPTMMDGALVLPDGMVGKIEASATRRPSIPCTLSLSSTTVEGPAGPMRQVPIG